MNSEFVGVLSSEKIEYDFVCNSQTSLRVVPIYVC